MGKIYCLGLNSIPLEECSPSCDAYRTWAEYDEVFERLNQSIQEKAARIDAEHEPYGTPGITDEQLFDIINSTTPKESEKLNNRLRDLKSTAMSLCVLRRNAGNKNWYIYLNKENKIYF